MDFKDVQLLISDLGGRQQIEVRLLFADGEGFIEANFYDARQDGESDDDRNFRLIAKAKKILIEASAAI